MHKGGARATLVKARDPLTWEVVIDFCLHLLGESVFQCDWLARTAAIALIGPQASALPVDQACWHRPRASEEPVDHGLGTKCDHSQLSGPEM